MRLLQLSDPHLVASDQAMVRDRPALALWNQALEQVDRLQPDALVITGDLAQDESWGAYRRLRDSLARLVSCPVALLPGNHDRPCLIDAVLGRAHLTAPGELMLSTGRLIILNSHWCGHPAGRLGPRQLAWLEQRLQAIAADPMPLVVALHHPPMAIGHPVLDAMSLVDHASLRSLLTPIPSLRAVLFGHIHQHWQGCWPERPDLPLLGCPSTLKSMQHVQPCPIKRSADPGGRLLEINALGGLEQRVLRWSNP